MATRRRFLSTGISLAIGAGAVAVTTRPTQAAQDAQPTAEQPSEGLKLTVSPSSFDLAAPPGATGRQEITVQNDGSEPFGVSAEVTPFPDAPAAASAVEWISVSTDVFELAPGESATLDVELAIPDDVATGSYVARVTFTTQAPGAEETDGVSVAGAIAVPFFFTIEGEEPIVRSLQVTRLAPVLEPDGRLGFRAELLNDGNVHTSAAGLVEVFGPDAAPLARLEFSVPTIFPGQSQVARATGTLPLPLDTSYSARATFIYGPEDDTNEVTGETTFQYTAVPPVAVTMSMCENLDRGPTLTLRLTNEAAIGQVPLILLNLLQDGGTLTSSNLPTDLFVWPEASVEFSTDLPTRLETGRYVLQAQVSIGGAEPVTAEYPFEIGGNSPETLPLCTLLTPSTPSA